jgi:hypothetical protein
MKSEKYLGGRLAVPEKLAVKEQERAAKEKLKKAAI